MIREFPSRVWEESAGGWYSREATNDDYLRRRMLMRVLDPEDEYGRDDYDRDMGFEVEANEAS